MFESVDLTALLPTSNQQEQEEDQGWIPTLSFKERLIGCGVCMVMGYLLSFGSFFRMKDLLQGNPLPFVLNATIGNVIALCGSCFLMGPKSQAKRMFQETRQVASIAYLLSLVLTLVVAFAPIPGPKSLLLLILLIVQYASIAWYCLSYIPFARDAVKSYISQSFSSSSASA